MTEKANVLWQGNRLTQLMSHMAIGYITKDRNCLKTQLFLSVMNPISSCREERYGSSTHRHILSDLSSSKKRLALSCQNSPWAIVERDTLRPTSTSRWSNSKSRWSRWFRVLWTAWPALWWRRRWITLGFKVVTWWWSRWRKVVRASEPGN